MNTEDWMILVVVAGAFIALLVLFIFTGDDLG